MKNVVRITFLALLALMLYRPAVAQVSVGISVGFAPPALPVYEQPACPGDGYLWTPGYWGWDADDSDYYWVPGTWVMAPQPGLLWTPAWWGWGGGAFMFHEGFWATEVGWYGGINYGFGYWGHGFWGGRWDHDRFMYNRAVFNINETVIHNVYEDRTVIERNRVTENRVSYNGGEGGVTERPSPQEEAAGRLQHFPPARPQEDNARAARSNPQMRASANEGKPPVAATAHAGEFSGHDVVAAKSAGAPYHAPANRGGGEGKTAEPGGGTSGGNPAHARDLQPHQAPEGSNDPKTQKMIEKQNAEHQKLQQQQQKEDQKAEQQKWNDQRKQQMEQKHAQQTRQMEQRHTQQQQRVQPKPKPQ